MACSASSDFRTSRRRCISSSCCCICCCFSTWNSRICANRGLNFVSVSQWEPWGSPHAGWKGHGSNRFPTPAHAVIHKSTVLFAILAGTPEQPFSYTCTCCHTYKCSVICYLPFWQVHFDQLFPTPAHAVIHTSVICHSGRYTLTNSSPHLRMLSYIQVLFAIPAGTLDQLFPTPVYAVVHPSAVLPDTPADTHDQLFPHTCTCWCTSKCTSRYTWSTLFPHLYMLMYTQVYCYLPIPQLYSNFRDFHNSVCHVIKMTTIETNPDTGFLAQQTFCFSPSVFYSG